jgi:polar amino acid transport system ATP-binding protein
MASVQLIDVTKSFGARRVLDGISLSTQPGEVMVICGRSGSGKSTLLRLINRIEDCDSGDVYVDGQSVYAAGVNLTALRARVGMVLQAAPLFSHLDALENVAMPLRRVRGLNRKEAHAKAEHTLSAFGMSARLRAQPHELSGGERQRVAVARSMALEPKVLLLDEPTSALDWHLRDEVGTLVRQVADQCVSVFVVTHDCEFAEMVGDRITVLSRARLHEAARCDCIGDRLRDYVRELIRADQCCPNLACAQSTPAQSSELAAV